MRDLILKRNQQFAIASRFLPGADPYDNERPLNIPGRYDGMMLWDVVLDLFPHISERQWDEWFSSGHLTQDNIPVRKSRKVRGGESFVHVFPGTVEPPVNANIRCVWEDDSVVGLIKPAPLPVHPCGRFNRNTLSYFVDRVFGRNSLRLVHRLDANTSGLMLLAKSPEVATDLREQFESGSVEKQYLARVIGSPDQATFTCDAKIGRRRIDAGGRGVEEEGQAAETSFQVLHVFSDGTSLVRATPKTGRTNQIRIHLWEVGFPILGDPTYLPSKRTCAKQTVSVDDPPMCLHAQSLSFVHPDSQLAMKLEAELPGWALMASSTGGV